MEEPFKILLRNKKNSKNLYPIILRLNKGRRSKIITLGLFCKNEDWDNDNSAFKKSDKKYLQKNKKLIELKEKAEKIIDEFNTDKIDFSLEEFELKFRGKEKRNITVFELFQNKIDTLNRAGKIGAAKPYLNTSSSLFKFAKKTIKFRDVTPEFLQRYETYLRIKGNSEGGVAFKMRHIRVLFNNAIINDIVSVDCYPFRKYKISKLKGKIRLIALSLTEWESFKNVDLTAHPNLQQSYQFFLFSYYTRGMNFIDMMYLKWSNLQNGKIYYTREKTTYPLVVKILPPVEEIINNFHKQKRSTPFIFPILLREGMTPNQIFDRKHKALRKWNKDLKAIAELAGITNGITSYVARHSYATHMKQKGASIEVICESLGHSNVLVTMSYLKQFDNSYLDDENKRLLGEPKIIYKRPA